MNRVVHFEIQTDDFEKAQAFYEAVFGWTILPLQSAQVALDYRIIETGLPEEPLGINGGLVKRKGPPPTDASPISSFVNVIDVASIDETMHIIEQHGGAIAEPKQAVIGVGWVAYARDPDGNLFGLMEADDTSSQVSL